MINIFLLLSIAVLPLAASSQKTPEELGEYLFNYLKEGSISKIDNLIPTLEELKITAEKLGIKKDSKQYAEAIEGYNSQLDEFHKTINTIYSDTLDNQLHWKKTMFEKVIATSDSERIDDRDPNSKSAVVTRLKIYFSCGSRKFTITVDDAFEVNGVWKLGNNIYLRQSTE